ncbi:zinc ABC transporter permease [Pseudoclavibacter endophyticus]|uniref:Metal ABC transporter permease n=1 Tax=Pseudoclavibacter endophyticus TaxID=1778590 RepID=A0A6H9WD93_9MICO|nr:metal ABC transporter permease [Pseudoclavibacter endophyticus]KAB1648869.1 metal ABC transporter permease [Pseudoclavibacter endophyticus]GGA67658.1 zinc ABC transporter permease [Pseudoclavibacter endophyticus]
MNPLDLPFMQHALLALIMLAVVSSIVGVQLNLRGLEFISDGLVHAVFPGVVIGFVVNGMDGVYVGAVIASLIATGALTWAARRGAGTDATTAVVLAGTFAIGIVIVSRTTTYTTGLEHLLFGQPLTVHAADLVAIGVLGGLALVLVLGTWKEQLFLSFDLRGARASGYRTLLYELALNLAIALVVVAAARAVGNLMVLAILIIPAAVGRLLSRRVSVIVLVALAVSLVGSVIGLLLAFELSLTLGLTSSPTSVIVLVFVAMYLLAVVVAKTAMRVRRARGSRDLDARRDPHNVEPVRDDAVGPLREAV